MSKVEESFLKDFLFFLNLTGLSFHISCKSLCHQVTDSVQKTSIAHRVLRKLVIKLSVQSLKQ